MLLFGPGLGLLAVAVLNFMMLIAARTRQRQSEFSIRIAMGATRARITRLAAMEARALCLAAAGMALIVSRAIMPLLQARYGAASVSAVAVDGDVPTGGRSWSRDCATRSLRDADFRVRAARPQFGEQQQVNPGFRLAERYTSRMALPVATYPDTSSRAQFWEALLSRLRDVGLVAAITTELPLTGEDNPIAFVAQLANGQTLIPKVRSISSGYFELMRMPVLDGRGLADTDRADAPLVVAVNQRLARQLASGGSAVGHTLTFDFGNGPQTATIIGIVADIHSSQPAGCTVSSRFSFAAPDKNGRYVSRSGLHHGT